MPGKNSDTLDKVQQLLDNLEGSELNIYLNDGNCFSMALTSCQLGVALSVLGFRMLDDKSYTVYSDNTLANVIVPRLPKFKSPEPNA